MHLSDATMPHGTGRLGEGGFQRPSLAFRQAARNTKLASPVDLLPRPIRDPRKRIDRGNTRGFFLSKIARRWPAKPMWPRACGKINRSRYPASRQNRASLRPLPGAKSQSKCASVPASRRSSSSILEEILASPEIAVAGPPNAIVGYSECLDNDSGQRCGRGPPIRANHPSQGRATDQRRGFRYMIVGPPAFRDAAAA
jgi:hypothetical protein